MYNRFHTFFVSSFIASSIIVLAPAQAAELFRRTVSVTGEGKVEATPDRAVVPVQIETKDKALANAKSKNDELTGKLVAVANKYGITKDKLKTSGLFINPQYHWEQGAGKQVFDGYAVNRSVEIKIDELEKTEKLIASLTEAGIDQVQGIQFTFAHPEALEADARKFAMEDARVKAQALAEAAGAKLGPVLTINLGGERGYEPPVPMMRSAMANAEAADTAPAPMPGTSLIQQSVSVVYELQ